jgi:hypothetical protein
MERLAGFGSTCPASREYGLCLFWAAVAKVEAAAVVWDVCAGFECHDTLEFKCKELG